MDEPQVSMGRGEVEGRIEESLQKQSGMSWAERRSRLREQREKERKQDLHLQSEGIDTPAEAGAASSTTAGRKALRKEVEDKAKEIRFSFEDSSRMKHILAEWKAKGVKEDDPVFLLFDILGSFDLTQQKTILRMVELQVKSDEFLEAVLTEMKACVTEMEANSREALEVRGKIDELKESTRQLLRLNETFLNTIPKTHEAIFSAAKILNEKGTTAAILNWLTPVVCIVLGVFLAKLFGLIANF